MPTSPRLSSRSPVSFSRRLRLSRPSPPLLVALGLAVVLVVGVAVAGVVLGRSAPAPAVAPPAVDTGPVLLVPVAAPAAGSAACAALGRALPAALVNGGKALRRRPLVAPAPQGAVAWGAGDPVVLRCGIERPPELKATSELLGVDGVQWFEVTEGEEATWYAVDRAAVVALTLPNGVNTGPIQDVSAAISAAMPAVPVF